MSSLRLSKKSLDFGNSRRIINDFDDNNNNIRSRDFDEDSVLELGQIALLSSSKPSLLRYNRSGLSISASRAENLNTKEDLIASRLLLDSSLSKDEKAKLDQVGISLPEPIVEPSDTCLGKLDQKCLSFKGYTFGIVSALFFCLSQILMRYTKWLSGSDHSLVRYATTIVIMLTIIKYKNLNLWGPREQRCLLMFRGFIGSCALLTMSFAFMLLNPSDSTTLSHTSMIITGILARIVLKEKLTIAHFIALILTVVGIVFISKPTILFPNKPLQPSFKARMQARRQNVSSSSPLPAAHQVITSKPVTMSFSTVDDLLNVENYTLTFLNQYNVTRHNFMQKISTNCSDLLISNLNDTAKALADSNSLSLLKPSILTELAGFLKIDDLVACYTRLFRNGVQLFNLTPNVSNELALFYSNITKYRTNLSDQTKAYESEHMQLIMGVMFSMLGASASSCVYLALKKLCKAKVHWAVTTIYVCWFGVPVALVVSGILMLLGHSHQNFSQERDDLPMDLFYSVCSSLFSICGQVTLNIALKYEDATKISLTKTTDVLFSIVLQYILLGIKIDSLGMLGALSILAGTFCVLSFKILENRYESYLYKQELKQKLLSVAVNDSPASVEKKLLSNDKQPLEANQTLMSSDKSNKKKLSTKNLILKLFFFKI